MPIVLEEPTLWQIVLLLQSLGNKIDFILEQVEEVKVFQSSEYMGIDPIKAVAQHEYEG